MEDLNTHHGRFGHILLTLPTRFQISSGGITTNYSFLFRTTCGATPKKALKDLLK